MSMAGGDTHQQISRRAGIVGGLTLLSRIAKAAFHFIHDLIDKKEGGIYVNIFEQPHS